MKYQIKQYGEEDGLSPEALLVAEILATPGRGGMTLDDIAVHVGTSTRTINRMRRDPAVMEYIRRRSLENVTEAMPDIVQTLNEKARSGSSIKAIEVWARIAGLYQPEMIVKAAPFEDRSTEALERSIEELRRQLEADGIDNEEEIEQ
ncbi:phBC6A51 family helix-turn-helix protein [Cohnella lupini]|uniref:Putative insertion element HTH domain-containing protein n=1 Tax=Cohnella lupini TaxID=1294267 RepID=A0A3D9HP89_9BACL|nr:phBC6A51 family helix-turn-helix protein [Cohnella lupini]RED51131.1 putative insertion element HTH domain-containing protein [Cohnella lupini]